MVTASSRQLIDGQWQEGSSSEVLVDRNPYDGSVIAEFPVATAEDIDAAYRAAARAKEEWDRVNPYAKRAVFENAVKYVESSFGELTEIIIDELGGTRLKAGFEIGLVLDMLKEAATFPLRMEGKILPSAVDERENFLYRVPVGVVGVISPFNFPFFLSMKCVAPALAAGNGVVLKPHEETPIMGGTIIGKIFEEAGLPAGLLNVVVTDIKQIGDAFIEHPIPRVLAFTGSTAVGRHVNEVGARNFKKVLLELGGNSAFIVLEDADLEYAVDAAVFSRFTHQGQICMSANRVLVHQDVFKDFAERYVEKVKALKVGDPRAEDTILGPLITAKQAESLNATVDKAVADGATPIVRGKVDGSLFEPVVLLDVDPDMEVAQRELFGPVVSLIPFKDDDDAVEIANNTQFGLSGAVHTTNLDRGVALARRVKTGMIHVNDCTIHDEPNVAFGGEKHSGLGRLNGSWSLDAFTTMQWVSVNHGRRQFPY
jgi:acyl-CoA reductase-like NAD-dependent aldehyde dehydrogenase